MKNKLHQEDSTKVQVGQIGHTNKQTLNHKLLNSGNSGARPVFFYFLQGKKSNVLSHSKCDHKNEIKASVVYR